MMRLFAALFAALVFVPLHAQAQAADDVVWIQIEAQPNLAAATERARAYADSLEDVNGFSLGGGWYGITVGPYIREDAESLLRSYRREGLVPRDSFIQFTGRFRQQFWPVGANVLNIPLIAPDTPWRSRRSPQTQTPRPPSPRPHCHQPARSKPPRKQCRFPSNRNCRSPRWTKPQPRRGAANRR